MLCRPAHAETIISHKTVPKVMMTTGAESLAQKLCLTKVRHIIPTIIILFALLRMTTLTVVIKLLAQTVAKNDKSQVTTNEFRRIEQRNLAHFDYSVSIAIFQFISASI